MRGLRAAQDGRTAAGACRGVPRRDTAAEAAGTGGVGTAGALAKKLSSPMSHNTGEDDFNVYCIVPISCPSVQRNKRTVSCKQSWFLFVNCFSAPDLLQNRVEKKEVKLTSQSCTWVLKSDSLNLYQTSTVSCSLCICDS